MRFHVLTFALSIAATLVSASPLPITIEGLAVKRRVAAVPVKLWRRTQEVQDYRKGKFIIEEAMKLNDQVYHVKSLKSPDQKLVAIKYDRTLRLKDARPYGWSLVACARGAESEDSQWIVRHAPSEDLKFFIETPEYQELKKHKKDEVTFQEGVDHLIDRAAVLAVKRVKSSGRACWSRMKGYKLDDFVFNFYDIKADVLMVSMGVIVGQPPCDDELISQFQCRFKADWQAQYAKDTKSHHVTTAPVPGHHDHHQPMGGDQPTNHHKAMELSHILTLQPQGHRHEQMELSHILGPQEGSHH